ncbi:hypothetical protein [Carnobacterium funditum]|nr:hypothetical protein [Carnobacterium funditum]
MLKKVSGNYSLIAIGGVETIAAKGRSFIINQKASGLLKKE